MSDFLSKFSGDKYNDLIDEKQEIKEEVTEEVKEKKETKVRKDRNINREYKSDTVKKESPRRTNRFEEEDSDIDPNYKKKKRKKIILITMIVLLIFIALYFAYQSYSHVVFPDFTNKTISDANSWASKYNITFIAERVHDNEVNTNSVIEQEIKPGKKGKKGGTYNIKISKGPDPKESLPLPDFSTMNREQAEKWVEENKANNLTISQKYSETIEEGKYLEIQMRDKSLKPANYKREDSAIVYFSRGKEKFEKNIEVADYKGKNFSEMESWAKSKGVELIVKREADDKVEAGFVVSQSVAKNTKIAKNEKITVVVSQGKAVIIPDFSKYTAENASTVQGVELHIRNQYSQRVKYGFLISQSVPAGTKHIGKQSKPIELVYSLGLPYIKDLRDGETTEDALQKMFFDEYQSKGANIDYKVEYITSSKKRGTVIQQSAFATHLPLKYTVTFGISRGNLDPNNPSKRVDTGDDVNVSKSKGDK